MPNSNSVSVRCRLAVKGTAQANANAIEDLGVADPTPELAMAAIQEGLRGDGDGEATGEEGASGPSQADH